MALFDCFTYFNEDHLLELRLATLDHVVDHFVIAEATHTQTGIPKPLNFNIDRFDRYRHKIRYIVADDMPLIDGQPWENERHQRRALMRGLHGLSDNDRVIVSDLDEIPKPDAIEKYSPSYLRGTFLQTLYYYRFNCISVNPGDGQPCIWRGSQITTGRHLKAFFKDTQQLRIYNPRGPFRTLQRQWLKRLGNQDLADGGWHFSWIMSAERIQEKINAMAHQELNIGDVASLERIEERLFNGEDILKRSVSLKKVVGDDMLPEYLRRNRTKFAPWFS